MIRIYLSESIFSEPGRSAEIALTIDDEDLQTIVKIAKINEIDLAILHSEEK